jgi:hypothetical protein
MNRIHITHWSQPNWHTLRSRFEHLLRDPKFWAVVIIGSLLLVTIVVSIMSDSGQPIEPYHYRYPMHPFLP